MLALPYPLYHGTGAAFWTDISTNGLGGHKFVRDWRGAEFLDRIRNLCRDHPEYVLFDLTVERMIADWSGERSSTPSNWRQGSIYLTSSLATAKGYAQNQGPEMIAHGFEVLEGCDALDRWEVAAILEDFPEIASWRAACSGPMIVQVTHIDPAGLRTETGEDASEELARFLDDSMSELERDLVSVTFEYRRHLPPNVLLRTKLD